MIIVTAFLIAGFSHGTSNSIEAFVRGAAERPPGIVYQMTALSLAGVSDESITNVYTDVHRRLGSVTGQHQVLVKNGRLIVDGKFSGLSISSYDPLNVDFRGQSWSYDKKATFDANYNAAMKLIDSKTATAAGGGLFPYAYAQSPEADRGTGVALGASAGLALAGMIAGVPVAAGCIATAFVPCMGATIFAMGGGMFWGGAGGAVAGYGLGTAVGHFNQSEAQKVLNNMLKQGQISCDKTHLRLGPIGKADMRVSRNGKSLHVLDSNGQEFDGYLPEEMQTRIKAMARDCGGATEAAKLNEQWRAGVSRARILVMNLDTEPKHRGRVTLPPPAATQ